MKKKGFTLLELLAVIIILAVIALIATPVVLNVVDEAKKSAFQDSSYGLIKSGEYYYTSQILNGGMTSDKVFSFPNNTELEFSGSEPKGGYIKVTKEGLVEIAVHDEKYCATKGLNDEKVTIKDYDGECIVSNLIQIQAPKIYLNGDILNITSNDDRVEEYEIYVNGELQTTIVAQEATIADGDNVIKAGAYRFNDVLEPVNLGSQNIDYTITTTVFSLGTITFHGNSIDPWFAPVDNSTTENFEVYFTVLSSEPSIPDIDFPTGFYLYDYNNGWKNEAYGNGIQYITISNDTEVSDEFYDWFTDNAIQLTTYDLSSLNFEDGAYDITVKAVAESYEDSSLSNAVTYEVGECVLGDIIYPPESSEHLERLSIYLERTEICGSIFGTNVGSDETISAGYYYYPYDYSYDGESSFADMVDAFQNGYYLGLYDDPSPFREITNASGSVAYFGSIGTPDDMMPIPYILIGEAGTYSYYVDDPNLGVATWTITLPSDGVAVIEAYVGWRGHVDVYSKGN